MKKLYSRALLAVGSVGVGAVVMAQEVTPPSFDDISGPAIETVSSLQPALMAVGGVIIGLAAVAMGIRWVKATFF